MSTFVLDFYTMDVSCVITFAAADAANRSFVHIDRL